jgi:hypothetical protein
VSVRHLMWMSFFAASVVALSLRPPKGACAFVQLSMAFCTSCAALGGQGGMGGGSTNTLTVPPFVHESLFSPPSHADAVPERTSSAPTTTRIDLISSRLRCPQARRVV